VHNIPLKVNPDRAAVKEDLAEVRYPIKCVD